MGVYRVAICRTAFNYIDVKAESEEEARDRAADAFDVLSADESKPAEITDSYDTMVVESWEDK